MTAFPRGNPGLVPFVWTREKGRKRLQLNKCFGPWRCCATKKRTMGTCTWVNVKQWWMKATPLLSFHWWVQDRVCQRPMESTRPGMVMYSDDTVKLNQPLICRDVVRFIIWQMLGGLSFFFFTSAQIQYTGAGVGGCSLQLWQWWETAGPKVILRDLRTFESQPLNKPVRCA